MLARNWMIDTIRTVYERYGFLPLSTPAIEYLEILSGSAGEETQKSIFRVENPEKEALGLRFDLTVPLARVVAQYPDLPKPFRRYQVSPVWRADKPGPGRFREFTQFDLDSVGVESEIADTEIITGMCDTLSALGVSSYLVKFSSRRVLNLLLPYAGVESDRAPDVFRVLDKLGKIGLEKLRRELTTGYEDESGDKIAGLGLNTGQVDRIERFLAIQSDRRADLLSQLSALFASVPGADREIDVLARISRHLDALGYADDRVRIDLSIARGLAYYTGPVFEASLMDAPQFGSVFGGGRYDDLVARFLGVSIPATGASIGVDRLLAALESLGRLPSRKSTADVLVTVIDPDLAGECLAITFELRRAGINTELYLGAEKSISKQLKYADTLGVRLAIVYGSEERSKNVLTVKDLAEGRRRAPELQGNRAAWRSQRPGQHQVPRNELTTVVSGLLAKQ